MQFNTFKLKIAGICLQNIGSHKDIDGVLDVAILKAAGRSSATKGIQAIIGRQQNDGERQDFTGFRNIGSLRGDAANRRTFSSHCTLLIHWQVMAHCSLTRNK